MRLDQASRHVRQSRRAYLLQIPDQPSVTLSVNETVELSDRSLLTIDHFEKLITDGVVFSVHIVGIQYHRFKDADDLAAFLVMDSREVYMSGRGRVSVDLVSRKIKLVKTNIRYPAFKSADANTYVCRYSRTKESIVGLSCEQADEGRTRLDSRRQRNMFIYRRANPPVRHPLARYTFADGFCGVGGSSSGARMAGLEVTWSFDSDDDASSAFSKNFPNAQVMLGTVDQCLGMDDLPHVDVLHLSPPCQPWSMAHSVEGKDDEVNTASLFAVKDLLVKCRPRIMTMEQVPGLIGIEHNK